MIRYGCPVLDHGAEEPFVGFESSVEILNRDSQMVDPARLHGIDSIRSGSVSRERDDLGHADLLGGARLGVHVGEQVEHLLSN